MADHDHRNPHTGDRSPKLTDDDIEAAKPLLANPDIGVTEIAHRDALSVHPRRANRVCPGRLRTALYMAGRG